MRKGESGCGLASPWQDRQNPAGPLALFGRWLWKCKKSAYKIPIFNQLRRSAEFHSEPRLSINYRHRSQKTQDLAVLDLDPVWTQFLPFFAFGPCVGILAGKRYLIHDRDPLFTGEFLELLAESGVKSVKLPPRSPNLNAHAERFVRSTKESCLERMIFIG